MPRLIWVFAGRTVILLVLSWRGSFMFVDLFEVAVLFWVGYGIQLYQFLTIALSCLVYKSIPLRKHFLKQTEIQLPVSELCIHQILILHKTYLINSCNSKSKIHWKRKLSCSMTKPTKWPVRPAKTQNSLGIRPVKSDQKLCYVL